MSKDAETTSNVNIQNKGNGDNATGVTSSKTIGDTEKEAQASSSSSSLSNRVYTMENDHCLLLADTTRNNGPNHLKELFNHFKMKSLSKGEILFHLMYIVALEMGYYEKNINKENLLQQTSNYSISTFFHSKNVLLLAQEEPRYSYDINTGTFRMILESIFHKTNENSQTLEFILSSIVTGDLMLVTLTPICNDVPINVCNSKSFCLIIPRHVLSTAINDNDKSLYRCLAKLDELSFNLREYVFAPMQQSYLSLINIEIYPGILGLPSELYDYIFCYLNSNQLNALSNVNKQLRQLVINSKHFKRIPCVLRRLKVLKKALKGSTTYDPFV